MATNITSSADSPDSHNETVQVKEALAVEPTVVELPRDSSSDQESHDEKAQVKEVSAVELTAAGVAQDSPSDQDSLSEVKPEAPLVVTHHLPKEKGLHQWFLFRYIFFTTYRRLFTVIVVINILAFAFLALTPYNVDIYLWSISSCASFNLFLAITIRQDYIINFLHEVAVRTPKSAPLAFRQSITKVYEFGGVHSGGAVCAVAWFIRLAALLTKEFANNKLRNVPALVLTYILLVLFLGIIIFAHPALRKKAHDVFERSHRFAGWISNLIFWVLIVLTAHTISDRDEDLRSPGEVLVTLPSFYFLTINTIHTVIPWLRLRKLPATPEFLSGHALRLHLKANIGPFYTIKISDSPLSEWHSFACFLDSTPVEGSTNSLVISKAGDWTSQTILEPKAFYWIRGLPTRGVLYLSLMYRKVVVVTTGSGIGPCLNLLSMHPNERPECRVFWSTPKPMETFGKEICDVVKKSDPNAVIWDTKKHGRPDMAALTWQMMMDTGAEAAFVISNPKVTKDVIYKLRSRGLAAYGPIFDS